MLESGQSKRISHQVQKDSATPSACREVGFSPAGRSESQRSNSGDLFLIVEAIKRLIDPQPVEGWTVVVVAGVALAVDLWTVFLTYRMARQSMNIRAAFIHNMSDALASLGVIIGGVLILTFGWHFVDAIVTLAIAGYILVHAGIEIPKAIHILMQGVPKDLEVAEVTADLKNVPGVIDIGHVHIWHIDEHRRSFEAHIIVDGPSEMEPVKLALRQRLADDFNITHSTLEFEFDANDPQLGET